MRPILLRRLAAISLAIIFLLAALPARTARRPHYGGTLRVDTGTILTSLDLSVPANPEQASAKNQIDSLIYEGRDPDGTFNGDAGSGPFKISSWQPGKQLTLQANEAFPAGRPFVDAVEIAMGRSLRDRLLDLELNKTDLTEIPPQEARHASERGVRISQSQPDELLALVFLNDRPAAKDPHAREIIGQSVSLSIDRATLVTFLLQKVGEPTAALLPQWCSGTSFLFSTSADVPRAKELWSQITPSPNIVLGYDSADALEESVAERIVVNAKEAGISLTAITNVANKSAKLDARLIRVPMISSQPALALNGILQTLNSLAGGAIGANALRDPSSPEDVYRHERAIVEAFRIVPLVWLPQVYGLSSQVRNWTPPGPGQTWPLADVWLDTNDKSTDVKDQ
jgi:Bacterial extracellular solute-binding proteins, family 5 Middle